MGPKLWARCFMVSQMPHFPESRVRHHLTRNGSVHNWRTCLSDLFKTQFIGSCPEPPTRRGNAIGRCWGERGWGAFHQVWIIPCAQILNFEWSIGNLKKKKNRRQFIVAAGETRLEIRPELQPWPFSLPAVCICGARHNRKSEWKWIPPLSDIYFRLILTSFFTTH